MEAKISNRGYRISDRNPRSKNPPFIPPSTARKLLSPAHRGGRHDEMLGVAMSLMRCGLVSEAITIQLRAMYDSDVSDGEICDVVRWVASKLGNPASRQRISDERSAGMVSKKVSEEEIEENVNRFLGDFTFSIEQLKKLSPCPPLEDWRYDSLMVLAGLFQNGEKVNIVTDFDTKRNEDGVEKARPRGFGRTMERDEWMGLIRDKGTPQSRAGAWYRFNPMDGNGVADKNVAALRFCLLESDDIPIERQASFFAKLELPIAMISSSGGKSLHALIRVDSNSEQEFREFTEALANKLKPFGFDGANKNPSRLSRLPGAMRSIGSHGDGQQRLFYLNPDVAGTESIYERYH